MQCEKPLAQSYHEMDAMLEAAKAHPNLVTQAMNQGHAYDTIRDFREWIEAGLIGDVKGCDVIMVDDMTATGGTLSAAAKMCRDNGAKSVHAFVSHFPLTPKGVERLMGETQLDELVVTDTIPLRTGFDPSKLPFKLTVLSVAPLIGEAIKRIHSNQSINDLFNHE